MAAEWQAIPFERLLVEPVRNGIYKPKKYHGRGAKIVNMGELFTHPRLGAVPMKRVELTDSEAKRFMLAEGDLLFARRSLVAEGAGKCSVVLCIDEPTTFESSIIRARPDASKTSPLFLYYFFNSTYGLHLLDTIRRQVAVAGITGSDLSRLEIPLPPLAEQHRIAQLLGAMDDKIELNRRTNETLEALARALFKSWFVDFDPVRAKSDRRDPGLPTHLADRFPDSFENSELGEIPNGWRLRTIGSIADVVDCSHAKKPERRDNGRPLLQLVNVRQDGVLDMSDQYLIDSADYQAWTARIEASPGDCVITNVGRVGAVAQIPAGVKAALGRNMTAVRCRANWPFPTFLVEALRSGSMGEEIALKTDTGTILDALNVRSIPGLRVVIPSESVLKAFEVAARPLRAMMETIEQQRMSIQGLRDELLRRLLSRELLVPRETRAGVQGRS
jgi:type I restriction enzyme, S subunit